MSTFVNNDVASGNIIYASDHNQQGALLASVINGGIDNANISSSAAIATSKLADDAGITTAKISDGAVTPAKLTTGTGNSWAWQSWTPTWSGFTIGNGTNASTYCQIGKVVHFRLRFTLGSTSSVTATPAFSLPVTSVDYGFNYALKVGDALYRDISPDTKYLGMVFWYSTTTAELDVLGAAGTYVNAPGVSSTVPFTWATGDIIQAIGMYEAA